MQRDDVSAFFNAENGGLLGRRLPVEAYRPVDAPLMMPTHQIEPTLDWWRRLSAQLALVVAWKRASVN